MSVPKVAAILPARMGSSRFPGKPLLDVKGLPMIEHVRRRALLSGAFDDVVVATCDKEIFDAVTDFGGKVLMTSPDHPGATDRVAEAAQKLDCTHVINVQGDEILINPDDLKKMVEEIKEDPERKAWNALAPITETNQLSDSAIVKCVTSQTNRILFCSRDFSKLPLKDGFQPVQIILGILGYEKGFLLNYGKMKRTPAEEMEGIDQNRILENDEILRGVLFSQWYPGINEPRERDAVLEIFSKDKTQKTLLEKVLSFHP